MDAEAPLPGGVVSLAAWSALGLNFRANTGRDAEAPSPFLGTDHVEVGVSLPIALAEVVTVSPFVATSWQWQALAGTRPTTWWGGVSVAFSF